MKKLLLIAATHGNESYSISVLKKLKREFEFDWIIGNPKAVRLGQRFTSSDLNRVYPGSKNGDYEERRAHIIFQKMQAYDLVIDIHGGDCSKFDLQEKTPMADSAISENNAAGYVVKSVNGRFLSRTMRFVRHQNRSKIKGIQRAWVHRKERLLEEGQWTSQALTVYPAEYDTVTTYVKVTGEGIPFADFLVTQQTA